MSQSEASLHELQILSAFWEHGPMTARELLGKMPDGKDRAYATVLLTIQKMERKGLLTRKESGRTHVYKPNGKLRKQKLLGGAIKDLVRNLFSNSPYRAMQHLIQGDSISDEELKQIRNLIRDAEKARKEK